MHVVVLWFCRLSCGVRKWTPQGLCSPGNCATSDDTKLWAITDGIHQTYNVGLEHVCQVHVFSDSSNMLLHLTMDVSHSQDNHCLSPFVRSWCLGSNIIQIILSTFTTSQMVWIWKTTNLCTFLPPQLALSKGGCLSYLPIQAGGGTTCMVEGL
jgi:hypothetical protein